MNTTSPVVETPGDTPAAASAVPVASPVPDVHAASEAAAVTPAPAAPATPAPQPPSARTLLKQLQQQFPTFGKCLPLSIGIDKQLLAKMPELDRKTMRAALGIHTGSLRYLRAMEKATVRYDLDGTAGAAVTDVHRLHAKETLQQRFKKEAERKKAEADAAKAVEADRLRAEKLQLLASKFSRN
ncbi:MAG: activator of osmoprotectant transporter prop [Massilia sp.]|jgi:ProP effector|nr:activator of osmoprotectant transporter prop [Massilia sp.]